MLPNDPDSFYFINVIKGMVIVFPVALLGAYLADWLFGKLAWHEVMEGSVEMVRKLVGSRDCPSCGQAIKREGDKSTWDIVQTCKICREIVCQNKDCLTAHVVMMHSSD